MTSETTRGEHHLQNPQPVNTVVSWDHHNPPSELSLRVCSLVLALLSKDFIYYKHVFGWVSVRFHPLERPLRLSQDTTRGCDVGCTGNLGDISLLWPGLSHSAHPDGVSPVTFCRRKRSTWRYLVCTATH